VKNAVARGATPLDPVQAPEPPAFLFPPFSTHVNHIPACSI